jgi:hypothetical protein
LEVCGKTEKERDSPLLVFQIQGTFAWHIYKSKTLEFNLMTVDMNLSATIPQIFYDIIARIYPGFLFLISLRIIFFFLGITSIFFEITQPETAFQALFNTIGFLILCYILGWVLATISIYGLNDMMDEFKKGKNNELNKQFQSIRLVNEPAAFRILKLRAETRMLECNRNAMAIIFVFINISLILNSIGLIKITELTWLSLFFFLSGLLIFIFDKAMRKAFCDYTGNIEIIYKIIYP